MSRSRDLRLRWRSAALDEESGLSLGERLTVCVLAEHVNGMQGDCRLALTTIGGELGGIHPRHARRLVRALEAKGWLQIRQRAGRSSTYQPRLPDTPPPGTPMSGANIRTRDITPDMGVPQNQKNQKDQPQTGPSRSADRVSSDGSFDYTDLLRDMP